MDLTCLSFLSTAPIAAGGWDVAAAPPADGAVASPPSGWETAPPAASSGWES